MHISELDRLPTVNAWAKRWLCRGMICVQLAGGKAFEVKEQTVPDDALAFGCGGWDMDGRLRWVGIDLDVGHGGKNAYEETELAANAALEVREFVNGAAEVRLSKSGRGVHIRIAVSGILEDGREKAGLIAKWLSKTMRLKCDTSVLGRQNLWFWARNTNEQSFAVLAECEGEWRPPPAALEPEIVQAPVAPRAENFNSRDNVLKRALAYMRKVEPAVSGQDGHKQTFKAACALVRGFGLGIDDARALFYEWNQGCQPPWSEKELEHKLQQASVSKMTDGYLLIDRPERFKATQAAQTPVPTLRDSDLVKQQIRDEISGKRFAAKWPWPLLHRYTVALLPGNVTIISAPPGTAKSFFVLQATAYWLQFYRTLLIQLEEDKTWTLRRRLGQLSGTSDIANDPEWTRNNPAIAEELADKYAEEMDSLGKSIVQPGVTFNTNTALQWLQRAAEKKYRIVTIDPVTARDPSDKPWIDDQLFVRGAVDILKHADMSLVLVTHPKDPDDTRLESIAGGKAFQRFTQVVLAMEIVDGEEVACDTPCGVVDVVINRKIHLRKTRNGRSQNLCIGYFFNGATLQFEERGIVRKV